MPEMFLIPVGACVEMLGSSDVFGTVREISIVAESKVRYRVDWWEGRSIRSEWFSDCELRESDQEQPATLVVGFRGNREGTKGYE